MAAIDFVSIWKACAIVLTGAFGILGLLTEFKDKEKKKITKWGRVSLIGIIVTTLFGVTAQLKESHDDVKKALDLATKTNQMLTDLSRSLSPLIGPRLGITLELSCKGTEFQDFCNAMINAQYRGGRDDWSGFPGWQTSETDPRYSVIINSKPGLELASGLELLGGFRSKNPKSVVTNYTTDLVVLSVMDETPVIANDGSIRSTLDMIDKDAEVFLNFGDSNSGHAQPAELRIEMRNGEVVGCSKLEKRIVATLVAYHCTLQRY